MLTSIRCADVASTSIRRSSGHSKYKHERFLFCSKLAIFRTTSKLVKVYSILIYLESLNLKCVFWVINRWLCPGNRKEESNACQGGIFVAVSFVLYSVLFRFLKMVSLIYFIVSEINILIKFR